MCSSAGKGLNLFLWKPIQQPHLFPNAAQAPTVICCSCSLHYSLSRLLGNVNSAYTEAGVTAARPARWGSLATCSTSLLTVACSNFFLSPWANSFPRMVQLCCSELRSIWSHCYLQHKKVTAEADGLLWIWVERGVVWAILGKRPNAMGEAIDF